MGAKLCDDYRAARYPNLAFSWAHQRRAYLPAMPTHHFPTEIWQQTLAYACTDGGCTGCALSLGLCYIRECCKPFKLHSVALRGRHAPDPGLPSSSFSLTPRAPPPLHPQRRTCPAIDVPSAPSTWSALASSAFAHLSARPRAGTFSPAQEHVFHPRAYGTTITSLVLQKVTPIRGTETIVVLHH